MGGIEDDTGFNRGRIVAAEQHFMGKDHLSTRHSLGK